MVGIYWVRCCCCSSNGLLIQELQGQHETHFKISPQDQRSEDPFEDHTRIQQTTTRTQCIEVFNT